jgi:hypothetical protein
MMHYVGIDWADQKHDVCIVTEDGRILSEFVIGNDWKGFEQLREVLQSLEQVEINLERQDGLLVDWLISQDWHVFFTPPTIVARRRPRQSKDDRGDAYLLATLRRINAQDSRPVVVHSEIVDELRQLTRAYDQLSIAARLWFSLTFRALSCKLSKIAMPKAMKTHFKIIAQSHNSAMVATSHEKMTPHCFFRWLFWTFS